MGKFGLSESELTYTDASNIDFSTCPFKKHKGKKWDEIPLPYMLWVIENIDDLHEGYKKEIEKHTEGYAICEKKHVYETFISEDCYICKTEEIA